MLTGGSNRPAWQVAALHAHAQHGPVPALPTLLCLPCWPHWPTPLRPFVVRAQVQPGMRDTIAGFLAAARASFEVLLLAKVLTPTLTLTLTPTLSLTLTLSLSLSLSLTLTLTLSLTLSR